METAHLRKMTDNFIHSTCEEIKYFKQLNIYRNIKLSEEYKRLQNKNIDAVDAELKILSVKIIDTIEGTSVEGQKLTGKKLIIVAELEVKIFFCPEGFKRLHKIIPFSTFIVLPRIVCEERDVYLSYFIEDITTRILMKKRLFISLTFVIKYEDNF